MRIEHLLSNASILISNMRLIQIHLPKLIFELEHYPPGMFGGEIHRWMILVARVRRPPFYRSRLCMPLCEFQVRVLIESFDSDEHDVSQDNYHMMHNSTPTTMLRGG
jgi:hypothetical protein